MRNNVTKLGTDTVLLENTFPEKKKEVKSHQTYYDIKPATSTPKNCKFKIAGNIYSFVGRDIYKKNIVWVIFKKINNDLYNLNTNCSRVLRDRDQLKIKWSKDRNIDETQNVQSPTFVKSRNTPKRLPRKHNKNRYTNLIIV